MSRQHEFRRYAEECARITADGAVPTRHREALRRMAQVWQQLAAEEEQIAEFVEVIDQLLMKTPAGRRGADRRPDPARGANFVEPDPCPGQVR